MNKGRWKTFAPILLAVLVAACVGGSLSSYTPVVYDVMAMPPTSEYEAAAESEAESGTTPESLAPEEEPDGAEDAGEALLELLSVEDAAAYRDGVYYGSAMGFRGTIEVMVVIEEGRITSISVVSASDDSEYLGRAEGLISDIIATQSTNVDTVSGATYSSVGIINAVRNALAQAAVSEEAVSEVTALTTVEDADPTSGEAAFSVPEAEQGETGAFPYPDGIYYGTGLGFRNGEIVVAVEIKDQTIAAVWIVSAQDQDEEYFSKAVLLTDVIVTAQSTDVDVVSGATYSSVGIINAVRDALSQAAQAAGSEEAVSAGITLMTVNAADLTSGEEVFSVPEAEQGETGAFPYPDGIYYGTGWGYLDGEIDVAVEIKDQTIVAVWIVSAQDQDEEYFSRASLLTDVIVTAQSADVDVVSGATYSSNGILEAVRNALDAAQAAAGTAGGAATGSDSGAESEEEVVQDVGGGDGDSEETGGEEETDSEAADEPGDTDPVGEKAEDSDREDALYMDGTYEVTVQCDPDENKDFDSYAITAAVTLEGDRIVGVERLSEVGAENETYVDRAWNGYLWRNTVYYPGVVEQVLALEKGNVTEEAVEEVDVVTSATCTSNAIKAACREALRQAAEALEAED